MDKSQILEDIKSKISDFQSGSLKQNTLNLFSTLGYDSPKKLDLSENTPNGFREFLKDNNKTINEEQAFISDWKSVNFCLQLTHEESFLFESDVNNLYSAKNSYLLFCIELNKDHYPNRVLADITRAINRLFPQPVFLLLKHGNSLTLSIIDRRKHKKDSSKDVLEKVTLIKDINISTPHRAHIEILFDLSLSELKRNFPIHNFDEMHLAWQSVLNISELNRRFYQEISDWYFWAREKVEFPNKPVKLNTEKDSDYDQRVLSFNSMNLIRLITRLIFVWFLKEKGLIRDDLFSDKKLKDLLIFNDKNNSTYYKAILQNLFFATLNQEMNTPQNSENRKFRNEKQNYNITNLYRYKTYFKDDKQALELFAGIPFLNGGLFECLDKRVKNSLGEEEIIRIDGFSDRPDNPLKVPDKLFFSEPSKIDLSKVYESKNKNHKVGGIINILKNYKFTVAENTPVEEEVALDPELLGKVFENLLASYNPETGTTARKQTGSFYTPREIVNYMVDESLIAYIGTRLKDNNITSIDEAKLRNLVSYSEEIPEFSSSEADAILEVLDNSKILDPACGSGAFPMGMLHKMVLIIHKLDPNNDKWKNRQIEKQTKDVWQDIDTVQRIKDNVAREKALTELYEKKKNINDIFDNNELDYGRKLFLIENCIYGVDIQPIAVQITKLRFFISLIVDQKVDLEKYNLGIIPLPNLETKFVAANTLIGIKKQGLSFSGDDINAKEEELEEIRKKYFTARTPATKLKYRDEEKKTRKEIEDIFKRAYKWTETASLLAEWNPYDQNASADWFDAEWMFGIKDGFDIVIGNPPYAVYNIEKKVKKIYQNYFKAINYKYKDVKNQFNLAALFIEKSLILLNKDGVFSLIVPHSISRVSGYLYIRDYLNKYANVFHIVDEHGQFENVTLEMITIFANKRISNKNSSILTYSRRNQKNYNVCRKICDDEKYYILYADDIYYKLRNKGAKILNGYRGIDISCVEYKKNINNLMYLKGKNIGKYYIKVLENQCYINKKYSEELHLADKEIVITQFGTLPRGTIINTKDMIPSGGNVIITFDRTKYDINYILAILNSQLIKHYFFYYIINHAELTIHLDGDYINKIIVPEILLSEQKTFIELVDKILAITKDEDYLQNSAKQAKAKEYERQIDQLVYQLYNLTDEEIKIVEEG